ncbi:epsin-2-like isoform X2 [Asterias amurensis]|uniref:epsin-2-like isoform X2 n=1 Tax=Asterias amurensis TaxID=7602 RepID=UPI003AB6C822
MATSRKIKNVIYNYNDSQKKVRDATSNDPWGPSSTTMSEIADLTYNVVAFTDIMEMIWRRINDKGKNWRHVYKSLVLLEYIIKTGSERVAQHSKEKIVDINTLKDFTFYDTSNVDVGRNVREKSKHIVGLLQDEERLKNERVQALKAKERFAQASQGFGSTTKADTAAVTATTTPGSIEQGDVESAEGLSIHTVPSHSADPAASDTPPATRTLTSDIEQARPQTSNEEELQLQLALAMSKEEADQQRQEQKNERIRLEMAINESLDENTTQEHTGPVLKKKASLLLLARDQPRSSHPPMQNTDSPPNQRANDPWAPTVNPVAAPPLQNDPWAVLAAPPPAPAPVPAPAADPWAPAMPTVQPAVDPWGSPASVPAAMPLQNDPWAAGQGIPPNDVDSDFDLLRSNTANNAAVPPSSNGNLFGSPPMMQQQNTITASGVFDMTGMQQSIQQQSLEQQKKAATKPEDFLGVNSSLVNLDSLVGPPKPAQLLPQAPNPFLGSGMPAGSGMSMSSAISTGPAAQQHQNPFQQQRQPAPTINQMRAEPMMGMQQEVNYGAGAGFSANMGGAGISLPPPLIPLSGGGAPQSHMQPQQANNPFLL